MNTAFRAIRNLTCAGLVFTLLAGCTETATQRTSLTPNSSRKSTPTAIETSSPLRASQSPINVTAPESSTERVQKSIQVADSSQDFEYYCESGNTVTVSYPDNDTAIVNFENTNSRLTSEISGSGVRYVGENLVWWTKGRGPGSTSSLFRQATENSTEILLETCTESSVKRQQSKKTSETQVPPSEDGSLGSRMIAPSSHVGPITRESSEGDLIHRLGIENVKSIRIPVGEGETVPGTRLFSGTPDEVDIEWKYDRQVPQRITIRSNGENWFTQEGLKIGSSLADVTQINGNPFDITGFEWDYPGRTVDWRGGKLSATLQLDFRPTLEVPLKEVLRGEGPYNSADVSMQNMGLVVETISVRWD